jgi:Spy/CpxP family protein refolding chaperone
MRKERFAMKQGMLALAAALLARALLNPVAAAEQAVDPLPAATEQYARDRKQLIAENLSLTEAEARRFWPVYEAFERDLLQLTEKRRRVIAKFGENYEAMTDAMAREILNDRLELEEERTRLRRRYVARFEKVLPIRKLARYYQIESKIRTAVEAGIAQELPLLK